MGGRCGIAVCAIFAAALGVMFLPAARGDTIDLADLDLSHIHQDWGQPGKNRSVGGNTITIAGKTFERGVGSHGFSVWWIDLGGKAERFTAYVGADEEAKGHPDVPKFPIEFRVFGDRKLVWHSGNMYAGQPGKAVDLDLRGIGILALVIQPTGRENVFAHGDWAEARIKYSGQAPVSTEPPPETAEVLTPKPGPEPRINGAMVVGVRPGHPLLYAIAATGERPITFAADGLPPELSLDSATGRITGNAENSRQNSGHAQCHQSAWQRNGSCALKWDQTSR